MFNQSFQSRLDLRGLPHRTDTAYARMLPWTRIAFAVGGLQSLVATTTMNTQMLWIMAPIAALAVVMPHHLIEYLYNFIRHITKTEKLPRNQAPVRFAFFMATLMLIATATAFDAGVIWLGFVLGMTMVMISAVFCLTHFCVPAAIWTWMFGDRAKITCALNANA